MTMLIFLPLWINVSKFFSGHNTHPFDTLIRHEKTKNQDKIKVIIYIFFSYKLNNYTIVTKMEKTLARFGKTL